jgi:Fe-S-cluster-containing dehydrogenase component/DMSO reductase anchor subunit
VTGSTVVRSPRLKLAPDSAASGRDLVQALLREQQDLTAVERFARRHEAHELPAQARYYRDLIPLERPGPGQQYAFEVDLDSCTGCKACVAACHNLNGLDDGEVWRTVGLLHGGSTEAPAQQTVTTSCHHCVDPACMNGCPVRAYEKDPVTGIVRHLDDQCFGCQYCTLMCPYDAPKYSAKKGIVRKCDLCSDRLAGGEAPACVQGCPNQAIRVRVIDQQAAVQASEAGTFLPGAPAPDHTMPTTVYRSARAVPPNLLPADFYRVSPEHSHPPLVVMLVLTQLAVGAFATAAVVRRLFDLPTAGPWGLAHAGLALALGFLALGASVLHLGRPQFAFRAVLGLRTSWLSREALGFGLFAGAGTLYAASLVPAAATLPGGAALAARAPLWEAGAVGLGLASVFCSVMVYAATRRAHWAGVPTGIKFFGTTAVLGLAATLAVVEVGSAAVTAVAGPVDVTRPLLLALLLVSAAKLLADASVLRHLRHRQHTAGKRVALLMVRDLARTTVGRFVCGAAGGLLIPGLLLIDRAGPPGDHPVATGLALGSLLVGELLERRLFFQAAPASRMPGGLP